MEWLIELDGNILLWIQEYLRADWMNGFWKGISFLGNAGWFWIMLSVLLLLFKKTRKAGIAGAAALLISALITNVCLKNLVARIRPYEVLKNLELLIPAQKDFSFPSGHTSASFAAAVAYFRVLPGKWAGVCIVLAALIALSRLYVGVHYPTDVLAGAVIGIFSGWVGAEMVKKYKRL
ncbi:MAG: phosphatase PAP2 family protein [Eubacteriales bacterium]|nr:phosphatase PAP2 family protein [Eubacteriales bacterium]